MEEEKKEERGKGGPCKSQLPSLELKTNQRLGKIMKNINLIIKNLNVDKAHKWDSISIQMIKLCGKSVAFHCLF